jgi:thymidine phosphorylase
MAVVELGGGRRRAEDLIDHAVGFEGLVGLDTWVEPGTPLARLHADDERSFERAAARLRAAYRIAEEAPAVQPLIVERVA